MNLVPRKEAWGWEWGLEEDPVTRIGVAMRVLFRLQLKLMEIPRTERFGRKWYPATFCIALNPRVSKPPQKRSEPGFLLALFL